MLQILFQLFFPGKIYICGYETNGTKAIANYWKNGVQVLLTDGKDDSFAFSIYVLGNNVYVAGYVAQHLDGAKYWKNGTQINISDNPGAYLLTIFVTK